MPVKLTDLQARCNVTMLAIVVHGDWAQSVNPWYFASSKGVSFMETIFGMDMEEFVSKCEGYSTSGLRGMSSCITFPASYLIQC
jgi:hypothetical protein